MNMYVLESKDLFGDPAYYQEDGTDTSYLSKATRFTLDDGLEKSRALKFWGMHYKVVRVEEEK